MAMYAMFLMTYTLFNRYTAYMAPQVIGRYDTLVSCQEAVKEADFQNVKNANEIRFAFLCVNSGQGDEATRVATQPRSRRASSCAPWVAAESDCVGQEHACHPPRLRIVVAAPQAWSGWTRGPDIVGAGSDRLRGAPRSRQARASRREAKDG